MPLLLITLAIVLLVIAFLIVSFYIGIFGAAPYLPTPMKSAKKLVKVAKIKKGDKVYDIGAGDGRIVHLSAKEGANSTGIEINPFVFSWAKLKQVLFGWKGKMVRKNFLKMDLSDADVIFCYLMPHSLEKYREKFQKELKKGTKIISYAFSIKGLEPIKVYPREGKIGKINIYEI